MDSIQTNTHTIISYSVEDIIVFRCQSSIIIPHTAQPVV